MTPAALTAWRARLHLNQTKAAKILSCSRNSIANWEAGKTEIPLYIALACAAIAQGIPPIR
jgi:DNA-binding XRE family transcriptional regulator